MERLQIKKTGRPRTTIERAKESLIQRLILETQMHDEKQQIRHELGGIERDENGYAINSEDESRVLRLLFRKKVIVSKINTSRDYQRKLVRKHFLKEVGDE